MFRIFPIYDAVTPAETQAIAQVQAIIRSQFSAIPEKEIAKIPARLKNPLKYRFRTILFVGENFYGRVEAFALLLHAPDLNFCYLDLLATSKQTMGRGIGSALYERVREEALSLKSVGLFLECLPDDPKLCRDPEVLKENMARLKFYEYYGARPILNTRYETPLNAEDDNPPYLLFDDLGQGTTLSRDVARSIVRAILERKYREVVPKDYLQMVVASVQEDPVQLREPRYLKKPRAQSPAQVPAEQKIALLMNREHEIHHVKESGYVEAPVRISAILRELDKTGLFQHRKAWHVAEKYIAEVHDADYVRYFRRVCQTLPENESVYPYVFPIRNLTRPPRELSVCAGYYGIDTFTPLNRNAYIAARRAVDCALTGAHHILTTRHLAYALVRPPGHHAERGAFGGFCYFNSAAIAAHYLSRYGKVAILDIDYHHGNGQQEIFYQRNDVLTVSLHAHPSFAYPFFTGFKDETGQGPGQGYNINHPLPERLEATAYTPVLATALKQVRKFGPQFLVVAFGADTGRGDPTGTWEWLPADFERHGRMIGGLRLPTLIAQEGGYNTRNLGANVRNFLEGLWQGFHHEAPAEPAAAAKPEKAKTDPPASQVIR